MDFEIYFSDLKEDAQKELLKSTGVKNPEEVNWDVSPITVIDTRGFLRSKAIEIMNDYLNGDDAEEMIDQLRSLQTEGEVSDDLYDYIIHNWDELLEIKEEL